MKQRAYAVVFEATIILASLAFALIPGATNSRAFSVVRDAVPGGPRVLFLLLAAVASAYLAASVRDQLHVVLAALWVEAALLLFLAVCQVVAAVDNGGLGFGTAVIWTGFAVMHLMGVPEAQARSRL